MYKLPEVGIVVLRLAQLKMRNPELQTAENVRDDDGNDGEDDRDNAKNSIGVHFSWIVYKQANLTGCKSGFEIAL